MTGQKRPHPHIEFAQRYNSQFEPTLNAHSAMWRLGALLDDIDECKAIEGLNKPGQPPHFVSYYAVGFVTCLEWHARARTTDLFMFKSQCITKKDFDLIGNEKLAQASAGDITIARLLGAMVTVGSVDAYLQKFERMFEELRFPRSPSQVLNSIKYEGGSLQGEEMGLVGKLAELFEYRNTLVHEIGWGVLGGPTLSDHLFLEDASDFGQVVRTTVKALEAEITQHAPIRFPNKVDADGYPIGAGETLLAEIERVENEISCLIAGHDCAEQWVSALAISKAAFRSDLDFVASAEFLRPNRFINEQPAMRERLCRARLSYLDGLLEELTDGPAFAIEGD